MIEIWKDIKGYEGLYQVSNLGRVKSLSKTVRSAIQKCGTRTTVDKIVRQAKISSGYYRVGLSNNKVHKGYLVHRLMAIAFIPNPDNLEQVNHKDGNKLNNSLDNLEWVTRSENAIHSFKLGLSYQAKAIAINVYSYPEKVFIKRFNNMLAASVFTKVNRSNIYHILKGKCKQGK